MARDIEPLSTGAERSRFTSKDRPLQRDVRRLGSMLGRMLRDIGSAGLYERVEGARRSALARRGAAAGGDAEGELEGEARLADFVSGLEPELALELGRAFSSWFGVVNLAERVHRERRLGSYAARGEARPASVRSVLTKLRGAGLDLEGLSAIWTGLAVEPVFTAHPTEALRRTMLAKELRMGEALRARREDVPAAGREQAAALREVREELHVAWQTDEHLAVRPSVADEREQSLFYLSDIVWKMLPRLARELREALAEEYGPEAEPLVEQWPVRFASWVGGDMDGNPAVDAGTIRATLARHAELAISRLVDEVRELFGALSQSRSRVSFSPDFEQRLEQLKASLPSLAARVPERYGDMSYRTFLWIAYERLQATLEARAGAYAEPEELTADLELVAASLRENCGRHAGLRAVEDLLVRLRAFGFHLATLDVRQDALVHREAVGELLGRQGFAGSSGAERTRWLQEALVGRSQGRETEDEQTRRMLDVMRAIGEVRARHGSRAVGLYVISMAQGPDDALAVVYLARCAGLGPAEGPTPLDVAPLFETVDDLDTAPATLRALLDDPVYRAHLETRGRLQWVMLGYSDSNKTAGIVPSRVALQKAQDELAGVAREAGIDLAFFHGRGGSTSRGGSKPRAAVLGSQADTLRGRLRVTEQGEIIRAKYGSEGIALRTLELLLGATLERTALDALGRGHRDADEPLLAELAQDGRAAYDRFVQEDPRFLPYFRAATPIDVIERMALGSRPASRREQRGVEDLRAIPWVFSWTQSRLVLPGWFGAGEALERARDRHGIAELRSLRHRSPTFAGLLRDCEMVLAKADLGIARRYAGLAGETGANVFPELAAAFERTVCLILEVLEADQLLADDPVLRRAIRLRNPYIDPMSFLQVDLLERWRAGDRQDQGLERALFASVHGIARGLQNTG
jgi:phosphoenolpyruvate carboxylase